MDEGGGAAESGCGSALLIGKVWEPAARLPYQYVVFASRCALSRLIAAHFSLRVTFPRHRRPALAFRAAIGPRASRVRRVGARRLAGRGRGTRGHRTYRQAPAGSAHAAL